MINIWGLSERSTYHATCVRKVYRYLKQKCGVADYERQLVADRITDALGCNTKSRTWYLCEVKVNWNDAQKGMTQIHDIAYRFKKTHIGYTIKMITCEGGEQTDTVLTIRCFLTDESSPAKIAGNLQTVHSTKSLFLPTFQKPYKLS